MAQKKLLHVLKLLAVLVLTSLPIIATAEDVIEKNLQAEFLQMHNDNIKNIWEKFKELYADYFGKDSSSNLPEFTVTQDRFDSLNNNSNLYVLVSSSMPKNLLNEYLRDAKRYGATIVFRGLPNGSFKELMDFLLELFAGKDDLKNHAIIIDEELFEQFRVNVVPAIVLEEQIEFNPCERMTGKFDKVTGAVKLRYALELFERSGELSSISAIRLKYAK